VHFQLGRPTQNARATSTARPNDIAAKVERRSYCLLESTLRLRSRAFADLHHHDQSASGYKRNGLLVTDSRAALNYMGSGYGLEAAVTGNLMPEWG